jgi:PAS domain S-box-containing protein
LIIRIFTKIIRRDYMDKEITAQYNKTRYITIGIIALAMAATMWHSLSSSNEMTRKFHPLLHAAMEVEEEITTAHLWLEEILSGDRHQSIQDVFQHLDKAEWYAHAMLEGGISSEHRMLPIEDPMLMDKVKALLEKLGSFKRLSEERFDAMSESGVGTDIDQRYDDYFMGIVNDINGIGTMLHNMIDRKTDRFNATQMSLIALVVVLGFVVGLIQYRYDRALAAGMMETDRARTTAEDNERWLKTTMKSMGDGIVITDGGGRVTYLNPVASRLTGWSTEEADNRMIGEIFNIVNEETNDPVENPVDKVVREKIVVGLANHTILISRDGTRRPIADSGAPIFDSDGELLGVVVVFHDITDRKLAEDELRHTKNYLKNVVDSMPSTLVGIDSEGRITQWNQAAERATGLSQGQALGRTFEKAFPVLENQMDNIRSSLGNREVKRTEKLPREINGEVRYSDVMVYPLISNGVEGAVIRVDDVTERVRLENLMVQTEKMMSVGGLAAGMAHEINNPLGAIMQGAQNILRRLSPDLPVNVEAAAECGTELEKISAYIQKRGIKNFLDGIRESGERASAIVSNMLQFSRRSETSMSRANIAELIDRTVELASSDYDLKKKFDFRHIRILRDFDPEVGEAPCIAAEIEQVILNLLKNAAYAMVDAGVRDPCITVRTRREDGMAGIEVEDNGPGMDEETQRRVFEPFFTTKMVGMGTGLGLSVSYFIIVENHRGTIEVESRPGTGARFIVRLPYVRDTA